jgi:hypothetical protein
MFAGGWGSQISGQSAREGCTVVCRMHRPPLLPRKYSWYSFLLEAESNTGESEAGRITPMRNSNDTIGNRTCDLPACSLVPQQTAHSVPQLMNKQLEIRAHGCKSSHCRLVWIFYTQNALLRICRYFHILRKIYISKYRKWEVKAERCILKTCIIYCTCSECLPTSCTDWLKQSSKCLTECYTVLCCMV